MKKIELKYLKLSYFKGVEEIEINFDKNTNIYGDNATGKTTIFDAYSWLLFGKDSANNSNFNIKTIKSNGEVPNVDHVVEGLLTVDGKDLLLKKVYKEIWTKKRGSTDAVFSGHTTDYYINDVPVKEKDYKDRIASIVDEETFKLISNPRYFSIDLDKKARRAILLKLATEIKSEDIIMDYPMLNDLPLFQYSIEEIVAMNKATMKKANEELKALPIRIDELQNSIKEYDFTALDVNKRGTQAGIDKLDKEISSGDSSEELKRLNEEITELTKGRIKLISEVDDRNVQLKADYEKALKEAEKYKADREYEIIECKSSIASIEKDLERHLSRKDKLTEEYRAEHKRNFEDSEDCPFCGGPLPEHMLQDAKAKFNEERSERLEQIEHKGRWISKAIEESANGIKIYKDDLDKVLKSPEELTVVEPVYEDYPDAITHIDNRINAIRAEIDTFKTTDNAELKARRDKLRADLQEIDAKLAYKEVNESAMAKIKQYKFDERSLATVYTNSERMIYLADEYNRIKAEMTQKDIKTKFKYVEWKLFETQINGGINEVCEATVDGVPYSDVNNAGKINAGLDIINTLSEFYGVSAPIFVDNAESVNELIKTKSQVIRLVVSTDKELRVE